MSKYMRILNGAVNLTSTNRGPRTVTLKVATYEQTKKGLRNSTLYWETCPSLKLNYQICIIKFVLCIIKSD